MNIAFWSDEDGCGTTSGMAAIASVCTDVWNLKTILLQSSNQEGDLGQKLGGGRMADTSSVRAAGRVQPDCMVKETVSYGAWDAWDMLSEMEHGLTSEGLLEYLVPVVRGRMYYLPQRARRKQDAYPESEKEAVCRGIRMAEQISDITLIDCGSGRDPMAELLLSQADAAVVTISQERQNLDAYFQNRYVLRENTIYLVNQYHQDSIYNKKNLNRLFRLCEEELAVIPHNPVFRYISGQGKLERFVRRHKSCRVFDRQFYFMQELIHTTGMLLQAADFKKIVQQRKESR